METRIFPTRHDLWNKDGFTKVFGFHTCDGGFTKEVDGAEYLFKEISTADELKKVVEVQKSAWKWQDRELAPVHILALMPDTGGGVFGAYDQHENIVGFAAGFGGGIDKLTGKPILISSMLAMADENMRSKGVGKELKIIQAHHAHKNGYDMMKWLYDPERGGNAALNIRKLGAMAEEFYIDKYGVMQSDLYGQVPTDRFRAVWRYTEPKTIDKMFKQSETSDSIDDLPIATETFLPESDKVALEISADIDKIPEKEKVQRRFRLRTILTHYCLDKKYIASDFVSKTQDNGRKNYYVLEPIENVIESGRITV
jgi:predicted GNAT superfamily acetyltransferase